MISEPRTGNRDQARGHRANHPSDEDLSLGTPGAAGVLLSLARSQLAGMSGDLPRLTERTEIGFRIEGCASPLPKGEGPGAPSTVVWKDHRDRGHPPVKKWLLV